MRFKKAIPLALSCALALTCATPTAASSSRYAVTIQSECNLPDVEVIVPTTGDTYLNPLELPVNVDVNIEKNENQEEVYQVISAPQCIVNLSPMPVQVSVAVKATVNPGSDIVLSSTSTKDSTSTDKQLFLYYEMQTVNKDKIDKLESIRWSTAYDETQHIKLSSTGPAAKENMVTLAAAEDDGAGNMTAGQDGVGVFHLNGDLIKQPEVKWNPDVDTVKVSVVFTFHPTALT